MRLLPFVVDPMFPWSPPEVDHGPDAEALARLVAEVKDRHLVKRLADIAAFREDLMVALSQDQQAPRPEPSEEGGTPEPPLTPQPPAFHAVPSYVGSAPFTGRSVHLADLDLTQRRTHILAAALDGLAPGPQRLLSWISVLPGMVRWDTLVAINPFRPEPSAPIEPDLTPLGPVPYPVDYPPPRIDSGAPRLVSYADPPGPADEETDDDYWEQYRRRKMEWDAAAEQIRAHAEQATREQLAAWSVSEPVMRARAQLDAALKDLEARGLLWWDRYSNTYDLHPIIRAFVHDQLGETDRVQANDRIRDHFQALPPEDPHRATSVEDLTRAITIFRALVGANHVDDASELWAEFGEALLVDIGAYSTVIELLCPLATTGSPRVRGDLAIAYEVLHRYDEAISQEISTLAYRLQGEGVAEIERSLSRWMIPGDRPHEEARVSMIKV